ncbi:MAG: N-acetyltransferase [Myxococcales bacterium]|nr:N-acetyltransferase [Myxococcales bacterium]
MRALLLETPLVRLEPLALAHVDALLVAAMENRATYGLAPVPRDEPGMRGYVEQALADQAADRALPYAIVAPGARVVGSVRLMNLEWWRWPEGPILVAGEPRSEGAGDPPDVVEIGHAWLAASAQRTAIFTALCALLCAHSFDDLRVHRVTLKTDARNQRSRTAIARLGAQFEGVLRSHLPAADGVVRDTAMFSIVRAEWPAVRARLEALQGLPGGGA